MKIIKKIVSMILSLALVLSFSAVAFATGTGSERAIHGKDLVMDHVQVLHNGDYVAVTTKGKTEAAMTRAYPEKEVAQVFYHTIYDQYGREMVRLTSTVTGVYSEYDHTATLTNIQGQFTGVSASNFSCSTSMSGATGTIYMYFNGVSAGSFTYKISTNGNIQNI